MKVTVRRYGKSFAFRSVVTLIWEENGHQLEKKFYRPYSTNTWLWWSLTDSTRKGHSSPRLKAAIASWRLTRR